MLKVDVNAHTQTTQAAAGDEADSCDDQRDDNAFWKELPSSLLADAELDFDAQAFFDNYMCTGKKDLIDISSICIY